LKQIAANIKAILTKEEKKTAYFLTAADALVSLADIAAIATLLLIAGTYAGQAAHAVPWVQQHIEITAAVFLLLFAGKNWLAFRIRKKQVLFSYEVAARLSQKKMRQYLRGNLQQYSTTDSSVHIKQISQVPVEFAHYVLGGLQQIAAQLILAAIAVAAITWYNPLLFLLVLLILLPAGWAAARLIKKKIQAARQHTKTTSEKSLQHLQEALAAYTESNVYQLHDFFTDRYTAWQQRLNYQLAGLQTIQLLPSRMIELFAVAGFLLLLIAGRYAGAGPTNILTIAAFMAAAYRIMPALVSIINHRAQLQAYAYTTTDLLQPGSETVNRKKTTAGKPAIHFSNVSFQHNEKPLINNLSFDIQPGQMVGLSGPSGAGKTTVINLVLGILQPSQGSVRVNGEMACVLQHPFILHGSLLCNIAIGKDYAGGPLLDDVIAAAGLSDFVASLPKGVQSTITQQGKNISGGQIQRIAIARALYRNANILVLDEPFNELDEASEQKLLAYFKNLALTGNIIILATHNPASLAQCDKIIMVNG
jgi:ABC-type multidrug transport system fused ATPase/permease subunit